MVNIHMRAKLTCRRILCRYDNRWNFSPQSITIYLEVLFNPFLELCILLRSLLEFTLHVSDRLLSVSKVSFLLLISSLDLDLSVFKVLVYLLL